MPNPQRMPRGMSGGPMSIPDTRPPSPMPPFGADYAGGMHPEPPVGHMDYELNPFGGGMPGVGDGSDPGFDFNPEIEIGPGPAPHAPPLVPPGIDLGADMPYPLEVPGQPPFPGATWEFPPDSPGNPRPDGGGRGMPSLPPLHSMPGYEDRPAPLPNMGGLQGGTRDIVNKLKGPLLGR